jgi:hypothetical protein
VKVRIFQHRFVFLLITLIVLMISGPILHELMPGPRSIPTRVVFAFVVVMLLLSAVLAVSEHPRTMRIAWMIALPTCLLKGLELLSDNPAIVIASHVMSGLFLLFTVGVILKYLFVAEQVTFDMICASLCVYLLLGVSWAIAYSLIGVIHPGSFHFALEETGGDAVMRFEGERAFLALYYSVVTLTTLGYGDIIPTSPLARTLAATQALTGQLYLAVLVARLVGLHIAQATTKRNRPER